MAIWGEPVCPSPPVKHVFSNASPTIEECESLLSTTYWIARGATGAFDKTRELQESDSRAARLMRRFGQPVLLLSWVPVIGDALVALAGGLKMDFKMFSLWTASGKLFRYVAVAQTNSMVTGMDHTNIKRIEANSLMSLITRERQIEIGRIILVGVITFLFWQKFVPLSVLLVGVAIGLYPLVKTGVIELIRERKIGTEIFVTVATVIAIIGEEEGTTAPVANHNFTRKSSDISFKRENSVIVVAGKHLAQCLTVDMRKFRFSGHETFPLRYSWLPKAVNQLIIDPKLFADEDQAIVALGIGKNMVRALRFWALAMQVVCPLDDGGHCPTGLGDQIFGPNGLDRFLEDRQTLWILHWNLMLQDEPLFAWDFLINRWQQSEFCRSEAADLFDREAQRLDRKLSRVTLEQHFDVFLHTYLPTRGRKGEVLEDNLDSPLIELELLERVGEKTSDRGTQMEPTYAFRREAKSDISTDTFIYFLFDFWRIMASNESTLSFRQIAVGANSIGQVTKMPEWELRDRLERIKCDSDGLFEYQENAAQQTVICKDRSSGLRSTLLANIYRRIKPIKKRTTGHSHATI